MGEVEKCEQDIVALTKGFASLLAAYDCSNLEAMMIAVEEDGPEPSACGDELLAQGCEL